MSDIEPDHQQNSAKQVIVNRDDFTIELQNYYSSLNKNNKKNEWTNQRIKNVIKLLDEYNTSKSQGGRLTSKHYYHAKKYDVMNIGDQKVLIMKRKDTSDPLVQIIPVEEYYQLILDAHIATGHGRRDKIIHVLRDKYMVPIFAISIFINLCKICLAKKKAPIRGVIKGRMPQNAVFACPKAEDNRQEAGCSSKSNNDDDNIESGYVDKDASGDGLDVSDNSEQETFAGKRVHETTKRKSPLQQMTSSDNFNELVELKKKKAKVEIQLMKEKVEIARREKYKLDLELLKMERELGMSESIFTAPYVSE
ncbi:uncharacterized protein LOC114353378 isoform X1 [Ostrinia furnacalis]|uniref:uncharacterized protein LOC114353378 isoform X1 n=1 Tax=Ostrinia furnacalis TaxID=93504 RepID=UPI00103D4274|nr:uncharacterized protein LOC114353378 isoform X1 [Ostrinia furnacalis]